MRILFITQYYTPEPPFRPCDLGPSLVERGHEVVVLTGSPCYPQGKMYPGYRALDLRRETIDGVQVLRLPVFPDHGRVAWKRIAYYCSIAAGASFAGPWLGNDFDVAFVYSPPITLGIAAILTKWLRGVPFVYDVQDLWPESLVATGMMDNRWVLGGLGRIQRLNFRQAAAVTVISPGFQRNLVGHGVPEEKVHVIPNWADEATYSVVPKDPALARELGMEGRFNIVYGGNMGFPQALGNVLNAAEQVMDLENIQFVFVGEGVQKSELESSAAARGLKNVRFLGHRSPSEMPGIYALADVLLVHLRKDPLFAITIPSKTIAYLASGRPILVSVEGDAAEVVLAARAGVACPPEDPKALADRVRDLRSMSECEREEMGRNGREAFLASFTRKILVDRYENLFSDIARKRRMSQ